MDTSVMVRQEITVNPHFFLKVHLKLLVKVIGNALNTVKQGTRLGVTAVVTAHLHYIIYEQKENEKILCYKSLTYD